jgi:hypothetical protein
MDPKNKLLVPHSYTFNLLNLHAHDVDLEMNDVY